MQITLKRLISNPTGTYGVLSKDGVILCHTLERPWADNAAGASCIPLGTYSCVPHNSPKHPNTWEVTNVKNRTEILIHTGNTIADTEGCILVGKFIQPDGIGASQIAMDFLRETLPPTFVITITN